MAQLHVFYAGSRACGNLRLSGWIFAAQRIFKAPPLLFRWSTVSRSRDTVIVEQLLWTAIDQMHGFSSSGRLVTFSCQPHLLVLLLRDRIESSSSSPLRCLFACAAVLIFVQG